MIAETRGENRIRGVLSMIRESRSQFDDQITFNRKLEEQISFEADRTLLWRASRSIRRVIEKEPVKSNGPQRLFV